MKFLIAGAGAIGASVGARMARAGFDVTLFARGPHLKAMRECGTQVNSAEGDFQIHPKNCRLARRSRNNRCGLSGRESPQPAPVGSASEVRARPGDCRRQHPERNSLVVFPGLRRRSTGNASAAHRPRRPNGYCPALDNRCILWLVYLPDHLEARQAASAPLAQIPTVLVAIVPIYHVPGVKGGLHFSGSALAEIFLGNIKTWDDPRIKETNPGQSLPHEDIAVVHRADGKGSNYIFTDFLSKISAKWRSQIGKTPSPAWPVGVSANRGEDMMEKVKSIPASIGYIELGFTLTDSSVSVGLVQNAAGKFINATQASIAAAYRSFEKSVPADFRASLTNPSASDAYPIISFTWLYVPEKSTDPERSRALTNYLEWVLTTGQQSAESQGYTPLPASLAPKVLAKVRSLH